MQIMTLCGSLREGSSNQRLLDAWGRHAPASACITPWSRISELPAFDPGLEGHEGPVVLDLRRTMASADAVVISSPEYAHGIPGSLKNALDWLVSSGETIDMPVALFNATPPGTYAQDQLREVLRTMAAVVVEPACIVVPLRGKPWSAEEIAADTTFAPLLGAAWTALVTAIQQRPAIRSYTP